MKLVLVGVAAFVLALVAGTGIGVMTAPPPHPKVAAPDSTRAEAKPVQALPTAAGGALVTIPAAGAETATSTAPESTSATHGPPAPSVASPDPRQTATAEASSDTTTAMARDVPDDPRSLRTVAKILAGMKPKESAQILAHLSDDQVEGILRVSAVRQASMFMAQLPAARASVMTRRLMVATPEVR